MQVEEFASEWLSFVTLTKGYILLEHLNTVVNSSMCEVFLGTLPLLDSDSVAAESILTW